MPWGASPPPTASSPPREPAAGEVFHHVIKAHTIGFNGEQAAAQNAHNFLQRLRRKLAAPTCSRHNAIQRVGPAEEEHQKVWCDV
jgi:hypothetical protein